MENKINVAELLKDCPKGMELDCTMYEGAELKGVTNIKNNYPIEIIIKDNINGDIEISLTKEGYYNMFHNPKCVIFPKGKTTWEGFVPPCEFKDGDIAISDKGDIHLLRTKDSSYCVYRKRWEVLPKFDNTTTTRVRVVRLATEEEKQELFQAIKDNGYKWNAETKTLEKLITPKFKVGDRIRHKVTNKDDVYEISKVYDDSYGLVGFTWMLYMKYQDQYELIPNKFNITTLKPFDKVLVRDNDTQEWSISFFSHCRGMKYYKYSCINGAAYAQCIPYGQNKHLLGTTYDCDEFYKTWEK